MAKEYIDKDRLILWMNDWMLQNAPVDKRDDTIRADTILDAIKMVEDSPAADVRENVKARWIWAETGQEDYEQYWVCSGCGEHNFYQARFCPNCGAQMMDVPDTNVGEFAKDTNVPSNADLSGFGDNIFAGSISADRIAYNDAVGFYDPKLVPNQNRLTNADRIRAMSDEEIAELMASVCNERNNDVLASAWLDWLKSPAEGIE